MITTLEPSWREWVLTNLRRNCTQDSMVAAMVEKGFDPHFAEAIVALLASESSSDDCPPSVVDDPAARLSSQSAAAAPSESTAAPMGAAPPTGEKPDGELANGAGGLARSNLIVAGGRAIQVLARLAKPDISVLANVLSDGECVELIRRSREKLARSTTLDSRTGEPTVIRNRSSFGTYFHNEEDDFIASIDRRLAELLRWPVDHTEGIQILRYTVGGEYRPHFDYFPPEQSGSRRHVAHGGQRLGTLIMYLNEVEDGGETIFPAVGFSVVPRRGHAVYFGYCDVHDQVDPLTLHGGAPVRAGEKWIATKGLRRHRRV
ncbi:MAG TPA: 2OG-Fe(II) oxygenase [Pirellulales bacterium]|nr:2OG-Fe(II) oxygenase [Pirellulales bacterium]